MYSDKTLTCKDCGAEFIFSAGEQEFYAAKGLENEPARCPECRAARKQRNNGGYGRAQQREMYTAICAECGAETQVPFRPNGSRPVYCRDCFNAHRR